MNGAEDTAAEKYFTPPEAEIKELANLILPAPGVRTWITPLIAEEIAKDIWAAGYRKVEPDKAQALVDFLETRFEFHQPDPVYFRIRIVRKDWEEELKKLGLTWKGGW